VSQTHLYPDLIPWVPSPREFPPDWQALIHTFSQQREASVRAYVLDVKYDAERVGNQLLEWGLPWQVVMAGYLWEYSEEQIRHANLKDADQVLSHISEANLYAHYIEDENLPPLLSPPYRDLGALLVAVAIYYQALRTLQEQSNEQPYTGTMQSHIESVGRTLLNIAKRLGMWYFKREIEDLIEQLRSPRKFAEAKKEHTRILEQDVLMLEDIRQFLTTVYQETAQAPIMVLSTPCGIVGMKRRLQDAHTTATSQKTQLTGFDLVTFDVLMPTVRDCYTALGILSQLGYIQDRVTDQIANPKPNGYSHIAFGLILKPKELYAQTPKWLQTTTRVCQIQIATPLMQAVMGYGCLHPDCYQLYMRRLPREERALPTTGQLWNSKEGRVFLAIEEFFVPRLFAPGTKSSIIVYDKNRKPVELPQGATALDFAYALNSTIGEHAVEALANNRKVPLSHILDASDIVEIRTSNEIQVQEYWLDENYTITTEARQKIKESLNRLFSDRRGYKLLRQELKRYYFTLIPEDLDYELNVLVEQHKLGTVQDYLERLHARRDPPNTPGWAAQQIMQQIAERNESLTVSKPTWIPVLDMHLTANKRLFQSQRLCGSCEPTYPRDMKIMGRLSKRSKELIVHRESCHHLLDRLNNHRSMLLPMIWVLRPPALRVAFFVVAQNRKGLILDLAKQLRRHQCELLFINAEAMKSGKALIRFTIETDLDKEVITIWEELLKIENVTNIEIDAAATPKDTRERLQKLREQNGVLSRKIGSDFPWEETSILQETRKQTLLNRFDISRPATAKMFFGRSTETATMRKELCDGDQGKPLMLYGPLRSGKSSICKNFLELQVKPPRWSVYFSLQNVISQPEEAIFMQLAEKVCEEFNEQLQLPISSWQDYKDSDPQVRFRRVIQNCLDQIPGTRLVLALDEFGGALESYKKQILAPRFFTYWRELIQDFSQISLILVLPTSSHNLLSSGDFSNVFSFAQTLPVTFLDTKSASHLLIDPLREQNIEIHPSSVALALKLTGRNPYYMTLIGMQLINHLNQEPDKQLVTDKDLHLVVDQIIGPGSNHHFDFLRKELQGNDELHILEAIIELTSRTNQSNVQLKKLVDWLNLPRAMVRQHLHRLRNGLILDVSGPPSNPYYSFKIELVRLWLANNRWFFSE